MKKLYFLIVSILVSSLGFSQGTETFDNFPSTSSSYVDGSFTGQDGSIWTHVQCRGDVQITGQSIMIGRNRSPQSEFHSGIIPGGVGTISFDYMQAFTTNVNLTILVNDVVYGTVTSSGEQNVVRASGSITVNQAGDVVIKFINVNNSDGQVVVDNVTWTGYSTACGVVLGAVDYSCVSNTVGDNNDTVTISIPYTGSDASITSVTTSTPGSVGGDDPAVTANGTITLSNLGEGDAWDVTINGGDCDGMTVSGTIPSDHCDPAPNTCFDLSNGGELFEMVTVATNIDSDEWQYSSGTYTMNGYCGGSCVELVDTWLIFGPLDMSSVSDLALAFDAAESFSGTDLTINYATSYSGCPSGTSWNVLQTLTDSGSYEVDLSSVSGTTVYLGVNYNDDGVDSYSSWSLSNIALEAYGSCPVLGTRPTSDCGLCAVTLGTETYACQSNTSGAGNDTVTVEIPYSGSDATITSVTTSTPGSVAGDDPAVTADGTITLTGLLEGDAWNITINGGNCDGTTISGTIPSNICDPVGCPNVGDIIITEIMQNPNAVNDTDGEWFEVFNTTGSPIDMQGWTISDAGTDSHTIGSSLVVPAGGYAVLGINGDLGTNGGVTVDYVYSSFTLSNSDDEVILTCSSTIIDMVAYDGGPNFPDPAGSSMQLSTTAMNSTDNDLGSNWGEGTATYGSGDIGTPGAMNDYTLSIADFNNGSLKVYPNPTDLGYVNIISANGQSVDVKVFDILGKLVKNETVSSQLDISNLTSGMYIMNISQNGKSVTKKLIVK